METEVILDKKTNRTRSINITSHTFEEERILDMLVIAIKKRHEIALYEPDHDESYFVFRFTTV